MRSPALIIALAITQIVIAALPSGDFEPDENPAIKADSGRLPARSKPESSSADLRGRQFQPYQIMNTTHAVPLWFDQGPTVFDVVQKKFANCWLSAASLAVLIASPDWMTRLFHAPNGTPLTGTSSPNLTDVQVTLWNPASRSQYSFPATVYKQSRTEDRPGDRWWNSAVLQGMMQLAHISPIDGIYAHNASFNRQGGDAAAALSALTGYPAIAKTYKYYDSDLSKLYDDLSMAYAYHTPMVISTLPNTTANNTFPDSVLRGKHAYAVMWTVEYPNGTQAALLRNPWGTSVMASISDIYEHMKRVVHLEEFRELNWTKAVEGTGQSTLTRRENRLEVSIHLPPPVDQKDVSVGQESRRSEAAGEMELNRQRQRNSGRRTRRSRQTEARQE